jgi:hypothetical protein
MDREWFTLRLLQFDIAVLVVLVLVGITIITSRLARDPSDSVVRWWQQRGRSAAPVVGQPAGSVAQPAGTATRESEQLANESPVHAPEWLERLVGGQPEGEPGPAGGPQAHQETGPGRRVA